jgi:hypothetical protein
MVYPPGTIPHTASQTAISKKRRLPLLARGSRGQGPGLDASTKHQAPGSSSRRARSEVTRLENVRLKGALLCSIYPVRPFRYCRGAFGLLHLKLTLGVPGARDFSVDSFEFLEGKLLVPISVSLREPEVDLLLGVGSELVSRDLQRKGTQKSAQKKGKQRRLKNNKKKTQRL